MWIDIAIRVNGVQGSCKRWGCTHEYLLVVTYATTSCCCGACALTNELWKSPILWELPRRRDLHLNQYARTAVSGLQRSHSLTAQDLQVGIASTGSIMLIVDRIIGRIFVHLDTSKIQKCTQMHAYFEDAMLRGSRRQRLADEDNQDNQNDDNYCPYCRNHGDVSLRLRPCRWDIARLPRGRSVCNDRFFLMSRSFVPMINVHQCCHHFRRALLRCRLGHRSRCGSCLQSGGESEMLPDD
jgi:hypothetical protein